MANITAVELTQVKRHGREAHPGRTSGLWSSPRSNITAVELTPVKRHGRGAHPGQTSGLWSWHHGRGAHL